MKHLGKKIPNTEIKYIWFLGDRHLVRRRGYYLLSTGHLVLSADPMISVEDHRGVHSLVIKHINKHDAGYYDCQVDNSQIWVHFIWFRDLNIE